MKTSTRHVSAIALFVCVSAVASIAWSGQTGSDQSQRLKAGVFAQMRGQRADISELAQSDLVYYGPAAALVVSGSRIHINGSWVGLSKTAIRHLPQSSGAVVAVFASPDSSGQLLVTAVEPDVGVDFVPGSTPVFSKATISKVNATSGVAKLGDLDVDFTGALHGIPVDAVRVGAEIAFVGFQLSPNGKLYASVAVTAESRGKAALGQTGSDRSTLGQTGSDRSTLGQTGSDRSLKLSTRGQTGSDRSTLGQTGSDRSTLGQTGSDRSLKLSTRGQTGSDRSTLGQTGSDRLIQ